MMGGPSSAPDNASDGNTAAVQNVTGQNWSGYAATGAAGSFTSVSSSWAQPAVTCGAAATFSAFWAGLDGDGTPTVEQTGTEADCANGAASYQGWYEIFPNPPVFFSSPVRPGDAMSASIGDSTNLSELTMSSAAGLALATPSALTAGNAFSVTADSGSTTAATPSATPNPGSGRRHHHHHHHHDGGF